MRDADEFHMTSEEFRGFGHELIDWIADYHERIEDLPVLARVLPGDVRSSLPAVPPEHPQTFGEILSDVDEVIIPGLTHWQSPDFFAYFPGNSSGPSVLGELLSAGLGVQGMLWATSPACTELETHVLDWMIDLCGLPARFLSTGAGGGVIQDSASSATLCAVLAAREAAGGIEALESLVAYTSEESHSSVEKGLRVAGIPKDRLRLVPTDETFAMRADVLRELLAADSEAGLVPFLVVATVGTTSSTGLDPVPEIAGIARECGAWVHVDSAFAGSAAVCPELRFVNRGLESVDSYCFNPHKWMLTNFDCSLLYLADRTALINALSIVPEYLRNELSDAGAVIDYRDWQVPLGRRFRSLKLWMVIRWYGAEGLRQYIRNHVAIARDLVEWVAESPRWELAAPAPLSLVCMRHVDGDDATRDAIDRINASGSAYLTHTVLDGTLVARVSIGGTRTERRHVEALWALLDVPSTSG